MITDRYLDVEGARLRYRDEGSGPPVLMLHGWTMDLEAWDPQVAALSERFRVVRFDRRGFGLSGGRPSLEDDARDIGTICSALNLERFTLVAMSQGTRPAIDFASNNPHRICCLVLDGPPEFGARAGADLSVAAFRELIRTRGLAEFHRQWLLHPLMRLRRADDAARSLLDRMVMRYPATDLLDPTAGAGSPDPVPRLSLLSMPVLVITGEFDLPGRIASADALARGLPSAARVVIAGCGHLSGLDNPAAYNAALLPFLARYA